MGSRRRKMGSFPAVLLVLAWAPLFSSAADILAAGQSIADGQTLVSAREEFELGFFSPGRSKNRYVGIWYHKLPVQTVIWVANRASPVRDDSGNFTLAGNGSLLVLDGKQNVLWSSNTSAASRGGASATLMDSGNFVVASSDATLWQTFDHPGNTFVPGMTLGVDLKTHKSTLMTSWKSDDDPSEGNFSIGVDPRGFLQGVMWEGAARRWRSGLWNGQTFTSMPDIDPLNLRGPRFSNGEDGRILYTYVPYNSSYQWFVLTPSGMNEQRIWDDSRQAWRTIFSQPNDECGLYNRCGAHGICSAGAGAAPVCCCMKGYEPRNPEQWSSGSWSGGCVRKTPFQCERNGSAGGGGGKEDEFFKVEGVGLPDSPGWIGITDAEGCTAACLRNCSCRAYAYPRGIGCMLWSADLLDMRHFSRGGYELFIRLAGSEFDLGKSISKVLIIAVVMMSILLGFSIYISWKCKNKVKGIWKRNIQESALLDCKTTVPSVEDCNLELPTYTFKSLSEATRDFSGSNILGEGGFGPVYKGRLPGGQEIAVKRLSEGSGQGLEEFKNEVVLIAELQHINLVRLLGCCINEDEKILVYEYMPNKSLDTFLFDSKRKGELDWKTRLNIIHGIARGLLYLHQDSRLRIIHRDLKASNILLDEEMNPKISDFGLARTFGRNQNEANTKRVVGTYGYMAPEYAMDGIFSTKSDVYSFGVLLLEIISAKKSKIVLHSGPCMSLLGDAWRLWNEKKPMEFVDPVISESSSPEEVLRCMHIGLLCVQSHPFSRPTMASVVLMLSSEGTCYPTPEEPVFIMERRWTKSDSLLNTPKASSTNEITISLVTGR